ncbi:hypothetical protein F4775DRAFT_594040 [Biscogniauxia sp. FL1348]|nr:hypothetical protein F4775DRAFT_594040 [Biscogniauxia sp. FL1348]
MGPNILAIPCLLVVVKALSIDSQIFTGGQQAAATDSCYWGGTAPFCDGFCESPYEECGTGSCGDGACCWSGSKKLCCIGGCPSSSALGIKDEKSSNSPEMPGLTLDGHNNDICDPEAEFLWCPLGAKKNKQCHCMKLNEVSARVNPKLLKVQGDEHDDLCKLGAHSHNECGYISSVQ